MVLNERHEMLEVLRADTMLSAAIANLINDSVDKAVAKIESFVGKSFNDTEQRIVKAGLALGGIYLLDRYVGIAEGEMTDVLADTLAILAGISLSDIVGAKFLKTSSGVVVRTAQPVVASRVETPIETEKSKIKGMTFE